MGDESLGVVHMFQKIPEGDGVKVALRYVADRSRLDAHADLAGAAFGRARVKFDANRLSPVGFYQFEKQAGTRADVKRLAEIFAKTFGPSKTAANIFAFRGFQGARRPQRTIIRFALPQHVVLLIISVELRNGRHRNGLKQAASGATPKRSPRGVGRTENFFHLFIVAEKTGHAGNI